MADSLADISAVNLFKAVASELDPNDDTIIELYIDLAGSTTSANVFGTLYKQAVVYLAAHLMSVDGRATASGGGGGATGPIIGERAGEVSLNYGFSGGAAAGGGDLGGLESTVYGRRYLSIRRSRVGNKPLSTQGHTASWPGANRSE